MIDDLGKTIPGKGCGNGLQTQVWLDLVCSGSITSPFRITNTLYHGIAINIQLEFQELCTVQEAW